MSYLNDLPLPDLRCREGDYDPVDFTLRNTDGTPVDLSSRVVELRLRAYRDPTVLKIYRSDASSPGIQAITINSPTLGAIQFTNPSSPADGGLVLSAERYHGYFAIYEAATPTARPKTVPQARELWIHMLPRFA